MLLSRPKLSATKSATRQIQPAGDISFHFYILPQNFDSPSRSGEIAHCLILYHFELFSRHASRTPCLWLKLVTCPWSHRDWAMVKINKNKNCT